MDVSLQPRSLHYFLSLATYVQYHIVTGTADGMTNRWTGQRRLE